MASSTQDSSDRRKLAFIIGNGDYRRVENRLENSVNNANKLSDLLKSIDFQVTNISDLTKRQMPKALIDFSKMIKDGDLILFYFSGHSYSVNGKNYLMPIDDQRIESNRDVEDFAVAVELFISKLVGQNQSYATICILDCCRPYVLPNASRATSTIQGTGLEAMKAPNGAFIQFACDANQTTDNDLYFKHLLKNIAEEYVPATDIFRRIADDVHRESNKRQRPLSMAGLQPHMEIYINGSELTTAKFLSDQPLTPVEKAYYEQCKNYYRLTNEPLISIADEVLDRDSEVPIPLLKFGIDEDCQNFDLRNFLGTICENLNLKMSDIGVKKIQSGSTIVETSIFNKLGSKDKKFSLKMIANKITDKLRKMFQKMKIFFMFMGSLDSLDKIQKYREEITFNPQFNRIYAEGQNYWQGPNNDGKDRGNQPYFCPVGWQRWSLYVTDHFDKKFKGWCICYHGTKFKYGLAILLSGLKPAEIVAHGAGIYTTPSINYACHPRYSEVKQIDSKEGKKFFKSGKYIQFVLECRVHPDKIMKVEKETLKGRETTIDSNISNSKIEWLVDDQGKDLVDFNDRDSSIVCTGLLTRITDEHPGLLPQSQWWYKSHLCEDLECCWISIDLNTLERKNQRGDECNILYN